MHLPVLTLSPIYNSDIDTEVPFSASTFEVDGKQPLRDGKDDEDDDDDSVNSFFFLLLC